MAEDLSESARRVQRTLAAARIEAQVVELPQSTRTAIDAAATIGCRVEQIAKSVVFRRVDSGLPVLVIASGPNRVDERLVASHLNAEIAKADADFVRSTTDSRSVACHRSGTTFQSRRSSFRIFSGWTPSGLRPARLTRSFPSNHSNWSRQPAGWWSPWQRPPNA